MALGCPAARLVRKPIPVYYAHVNFRCGSTPTRAFLVLWFWAALSAPAQTKHIRLRNEQITTTAPALDAAVRAAQAHPRPASGLFLIQFTERFEPAWRTVLRDRKVELLWPVPDDAFVARLSEARLEELQAL